MVEYFHKTNGSERSEQRGAFFHALARCVKSLHLAIIHGKSQLCKEAAALQMDVFFYLKSISLISAAVCLSFFIKMHLISKSPLSN